MNNPIPVPSKGDGLKATWAASVANGVNALMPIAASGMLARNGAGGVGCESFPANRRDRHPQFVPPWTFRCAVTNPGTDNETREGGWVNAQAQLGLDCRFFGDYDLTRKVDLSSEHHPSGVGGTIEDCDQTEDGTYYLEIKPHASSGKLKLVRYGSGGRDGSPRNDFANDTYYVYIGTVENGIQTDGIYCVPVIYKYL